MKFKPYWELAPDKKTVTQRVNEVKHRPEIDVPLKLWRLEDASHLWPLDTIDDGFVNSTGETCYPSVVGLATEYLTHVALGEPVWDAFDVSMAGARLVSARTGSPVWYHTAETFANRIQDEADHGRATSDLAIRYAVSLGAFDVGYRVGPDHFHGGLDAHAVDTITTEHIRIMVQRSLSWMTYDIRRSGRNRVAVFGPEFGRECFMRSSELVAGDGDFVINADWRGREGNSNRVFGDSYAFCDFKCVKTPRPGFHYRLQLLVYWLLGLMDTSRYDRMPDGLTIYQHIDRLVVWNTRYGQAWWLDLVDVDPEIFHRIAVDVIGYPEACWEYTMAGEVYEGQLKQAIRSALVKKTEVTLPW